MSKPGSGSWISQRDVGVVRRTNWTVAFALSLTLVLLLSASGARAKSSTLADRESGQRMSRSQNTR